MQLTLTQEQVSQVVSILKDGGEGNRSGVDAALASNLAKQRRFSGKSVDVYLTNQDAQRVRRILKANGRSRPMTPLPKELTPMTQPSTTAARPTRPETTAGPVKTPLTIEERDGRRVWTVTKPPATAPESPPAVDPHTRRFGPITPRRCARCGTTFTPRAANGKYCDSCRSIAGKEQKAAYMKRWWVRRTTAAAAAEAVPPDPAPGQPVVATPIAAVTAGAATARLEKRGVEPWTIFVDGIGYLDDDNAIVLGEWLVAAGRYAKAKGTSL